jgi:hypothetical protein
MRKLTALGVVGSAGKAHTVYGKNWMCPACKQPNYASRDVCTRCKTARPAGAQEIVMTPALEAALEGRETAWKEALDPATRQIYYYNPDTKETSWTRPAEMGAAPYATGFFGRGAVGENVQAKHTARNAEWLKRPARKQSSIDPTKMQKSDGAQEVRRLQCFA